MLTEKELVEEAIHVLHPVGQAGKQYLSYSFGERSMRRIPDLVFVPYDGPNRDVPIVVEVKTSAGKGSLAHVTFLSVLNDFENIRQANPHPIKFVLATTQRITEDQKKTADEHGLMVFDGIKSGDELARELLKWANLAK